MDKMKSPIQRLLEEENLYDQVWEQILTEAFDGIDKTILLYTIFYKFTSDKVETVFNIIFGDEGNTVYKVFKNENSDFGIFLNSISPKLTQLIYDYFSFKIEADGLIGCVIRQFWKRYSEERLAGKNCPPIFEDIPLYIISDKNSLDAWAQSYIERDKEEKNKILMYCWVNSAIAINEKI